MRKSLFSALAVLTALTAGGAQTFEVASVKKITTNDGRVTFNFTPARVELLLPLRMIIQIAFDVRDFQLVGGPGWINSDHFEIIATKPGETSPEQTRLMLQALLTERFKLATHKETKDAPTYTLVMARSDGRMGPQLRKTEVDCAALGPNPPRAPSSSKAWCGLRGTGPRRITGQGATMAEFARVLLTGWAGGLVIDETGLAGGYDFDFFWFPPQTVDDFGPPLVTALEDQLGLKLTPTKRAIEFLVIDRVEQPSEN